MLNEWMMHLYIAILCIAVHAKVCNCSGAVDWWSSCVRIVAFETHAAVLIWRQTSHRMLSVLCLQHILNVAFIHEAWNENLVMLPEFLHVESMWTSIIHAHMRLMSNLVFDVLLWPCVSDMCLEPSWLMCVDPDDLWPRSASLWKTPNTIQLNAWDTQTNAQELGHAAGLVRNNQLDSIKLLYLSHALRPRSGLLLVL